MKNKTEEIRETALEMLENDDDLFVDMVNELDDWNGFADEFRCYPMDEIDDILGDMAISDFLSAITEDFNKADEFFIKTIYGLESTDDLAEYYHDNVDTDDLLDNLIDNYYNINIYDNDFDELVEELTAEEETA